VIPSPKGHWLGLLQHRSLRSLLVVVVGGALLPVFLISFAQAYMRMENDRETIRSSLTDNASIAAEQGSNVVALSQQSLVNLSNRREVKDATTKCQQTLLIALLGMPFGSNLARIDQNGKILCSAHPIVITANVKDRKWWQELSARSTLSFAGPVLDRANGKPSLIVAIGLNDDEGDKLGHIVLGIDILRLQNDLTKRALDRRASLTLVAGDGRPINTMFLTRFQLPQSGSHFEARNFENTSLDVLRDDLGQAWSQAVRPIVPDHLYVSYAMPNKVLYSSTLFHSVTDLALPLMALLLACAASWFAIEFWAIRPIEQLRILAKNYALGQFSATLPSFARGPQELIDLRDELAAMAERADQRDENLRQIADQKDNLVKELHHRVKNNIQVVLSLLSLQARQLATPEERAPLEQVQARVSSLALVQRLIVEGSDGSHVSTIDIHLLIDDLCSQIRRSYPQQAQRVKLIGHADPLPISTDLAVPISMFVFEAVTNAMLHAFPDQARGEIFVDFRVDVQSIAHLEITDTGIGWELNAPNLGTGHKLLTAFGRQLGSFMVLTRPPTQGSCVSVTFPLSSSKAVGSEPL
jgi:two-component sensor histidine kinase